MEDECVASVSRSRWTMRRALRGDRTPRQRRIEYRYMSRKRSGQKRTRSRTARSRLIEESDTVQTQTLPSSLLRFPLPYILSFICCLIINALCLPFTSHSPPSAICARDSLNQIDIFTIPQPRIVFMTSTTLLLMVLFATW